MFGRHNKMSTEWLAQLPLFSSFGEADLKAVAELGERDDRSDGDLIIDQGRVGDSCYAIVEGRVRVYSGNEYVATIGPGTMVGEMALVEHRPRNATVVAEGDVVLVRFGLSEFNELLERSPEAKGLVLSLLESRALENQRRHEF